MAKAKKREDLLWKHIEFALKDKQHIAGTIIQAWEESEGMVRFQLKEDGTDELMWFELRHKPPGPSLPNAPKVQPCATCGRPAVRKEKTLALATYRCCAGHNTVVKIGTSPLPI